ncbi:MAG: hypothetical protein ACYCV1_11450 [Acidimicrobiales bacterium]
MRLGVSWHGLRRALDGLTNIDTTTVATSPGKPAVVALRPGRLLHAKGDDRHWYAANSATVAQLASEHGLSATWIGWILAAAMAGDDQFGSIRQLAGTLPGCRRSLRRGLDELAARGLAALEGGPGRAISVRLMVLAALAAHAPTVALKRSARRSLVRNAASNGRDERIDDALDRLCRHFGVPRSPALRAALAAAIATGMDTRSMIERVAAMGQLAAARNPEAVLVARIQAVRSDQIVANERRARANRTAVLPVPTTDGEERQVPPQLLDAWDAWLGTHATLEDRQAIEAALSPAFAARLLVTSHAANGPPPGPAPGGAGLIAQYRRH